MECRCGKSAFDVLRGNEADYYARQHLTKAWVNSAAWLKGYQCPLTQTLWVMSYPQSHLHGGGPPEMRRASTADWAAARGDA